MCELLVEKIKIAHGGYTRNVITAADLLDGNSIFESKYDLGNQTTGYTVIAREEGVLLKEALATVAAISALTQMQEGISGQRKILDGLHSIVVYTISLRATAGTGVLAPRQFNADVKLI